MMPACRLYLVVIVSLVDDGQPPNKPPFFSTVAQNIPEEALLDNDDD